MKVFKSQPVSAQYLKDWQRVGISQNHRCLHVPILKVLKKGINILVLQSYQTTLHFDEGVYRKFIIDSSYRVIQIITEQESYHNVKQ